MTVESAFDRLLARVASTDPAPSFVSVPKAAGRYEVGRKLGRGGLGVVHVGWDPELHREVALKFVRPDRIVGESGRTLFERLRREARTLAQLDHPALVRVFDIGEAEGQLYIAMELLDGSTLRTWARRQRSWRAIADACIEAARGIAAAHACGVIHRDIKPDNIIVVDRTERVVVVDFGLADPQTAIGATPGDSEEQSSSRLTRDGAVMGTHGYLAPELGRGAVASPLSDQYAWCVSCRELLAERGPEALSRVLERGLDDDPARRHASMDALIREVERARSPTRRRLGALMGVIAAGLMLAVGWSQLDEQRKISRCEAEGAAIEDVWNDDTRTTVRTELLATGLDYAAGTVERVLPRIDARVEAWRRTRTEACLDDSLEGPQLDRALWCLDENRIDLEAIVATLSHPDPSVVEAAADLDAGLLPVERCRDRSLLDTLPTPPDTDQRSELRAARGQLATARMLVDDDAALAAAEALVARASALDWPPLEAAARLQLGRARMSVEDRERASSDLEDAYFLADHVGAWSIAADAAARLCFCHAADLELAERWSKASAIALAELPVGERFVEADRLSSLAIAYKTAGDFDRAIQLLRQSVELAEREFGDEHPRTGVLTRTLGAVMFENGDVVEARPVLERSLALLERSLGPEHPAVATTLDNLGLTFAEAGDYARARPLCERALALRERALAADTVHIVASLNNLAAIDSGVGEHARAAELMERAIPMQERLVGPDHPDVAGMLHNLGNYYLRMEDYERAVAMHERAFVVLEQALGPHHRDTARILVSLADGHLLKGNLDEAERRYEEAIAAFERSVGPDEPRIAPALQGLAELAVERGQAGTALPLARRALDLARRGAPDPGRVANIEFVLARAMWDAGEDRNEARALAEKALADFGDAADLWAPTRSHVEAWLAAHPR